MLTASGWGRGGGWQAGCKRSAARVVSEMDEGSSRSCSRVWRVEKSRRRRDGRDDGSEEKWAARADL